MSEAVFINKMIEVFDPKPQGSSQMEGLTVREARVIEILKDTGAFLDGHFLLKSGKHSARYINKDALYPHTRETTEICHMMAGDFKDQKIDVVVGPEKGGIILSNNVADELTRLTGRVILGVYAEKSPTGGFVFNRGYDSFVKGKRVLITEDILTTGGSVKEVIEAITKVGGEAVGVAGICNRGEVKAKDLGVPVLSALINLNILAWEPNECSLCAAGVLIDDQVGHGRKAS